MGLPAPPIHCMGCVHFRGLRAAPALGRPGFETPTTYVCDAFPGGTGIPEPIASGRDDHTRPHPGDRGIRYEPA